MNSSRFSVSLAIWFAAACGIGLTGIGLGCSTSETCQSDADCFRGQRCDRSGEGSTGICVSLDASTPADTAEADAADTGAGGDTDVEEGDSRVPTDGTDRDTDGHDTETASRDADSDSGDAADGSDASGDAGPIGVCSNTGDASGEATTLKLDPEPSLWLIADTGSVTRDNDNAVGKWQGRTDMATVMDVGRYKYRPTWHSEGIHGNDKHPYVEFDGADSGSGTPTYLSTANGEAYLSSATATILAVVKNNDPNGGGALFSSCGSSFDSHQIRFGSESAGGHGPETLFFTAQGHPIFGDGEVVRGGSQARGTDAWQVLTIVLTEEGAIVRQNGKPFGSHTEALGDRDAGEWAFNGMGARCPEQSLAVEHLDGGIAELLVYEERIDRDSLCKIEGALKRHYELE